MARSALAVLRTSSPSSSPLMRVRPVASAPNIRARCDTDLSPGTVTRPDSAPGLVAVSGEKRWCGKGSLAAAVLTLGGGMLQRNRAAAPGAVNRARDTKSPFDSVAGTWQGAAKPPPGPQFKETHFQRLSHVDQSRARDQAHVP